MNDGLVQSGLPAQNQSNALSSRLTLWYVRTLEHPSHHTLIHTRIFHIRRPTQGPSWFACPKKRLHSSLRMRVQLAECSVTEIRYPLSFARFMLLLSVALLLTIYCIDCVAE